MNIIQLLLGVFELKICLKFINLFFESKYSEKTTKVITWVFIIIISMLISFNRQISGYSLALIWWLILIISVFAYYIYIRKGSFNFTIVGLYYLTLTIFDLFFVYTFGVLLQCPTFGIQLSESIGVERMVTLFVARFIMYIVFVVAKKVEVCNIINEKNAKILNIIIGIEAFGIYIFQYIYGYDITIAIASSWYIFFLAFMFAFFAVIIYFYLKVQREKFKYATLRAKLLEYNYHNIYEGYMNSQKIYHDMKNHLIIINQYILENENNKALEYIQSIKGPIFYLDNSVWSGIKVIDFVLNYKLMEAQKEKIKVEYNIDKITNREFLIQDNELCALLSNLLDNAIDACKILEEDKREIKVTIKYINNMLIIKTCNRTLNPPVKKNGKYITQKKDKYRHGIGISSIKNVVSKYEGCIDFTYYKEQFSVSLTLFC